jgi:putative oxidoreductase
MMTHGWPKFQKILEGNWKMGDPIGLGVHITLVLAVFSEFIAPALILVGWKTRILAFFPAATMFVAAFIVHFDDPWKKQELPLIYLFGFLAILFLGSGRYSLDGQLKARK